MFIDEPGKSPWYESSKSIVPRSIISIVELGCIGEPGIAPQSRNVIVDSPDDTLLVIVYNASSLVSGSLMPLISISTCG